MSTLRKDGESGGIIMGNNNQNDINCLQIIIKIVILSDNLYLLRNFFVILGIYENKDKTFIKLFDIRGAGSIISSAES